MKRRPPRGLDPEEKALWDRVAKTANPLQTKRPSPALTLKSQPPEQKARSVREPIAPFEVGAKSSTAVPSHSYAPPVSDRLDARPIEMDQKAFRRLKRGQSTPEARLDLHGMTVDAARGALTSFILSSQGAGRRLVLVITGKGRVRHDAGPIPNRVGVLRNHVPDWLNRPPLSATVLQVVQAHQRHGGSGAFYVYLRRR